MKSLAMVSAFTLFTVFCLSGCQDVAKDKGQTSSTSVTTKDAAVQTAFKLTVENPYVRAVPPGQTNSASFMIVTNTGSEDRRIVGMASSVAQHIELHEHTHENGMMKMRQVTGGIEVSAGQRVELKSGGLHIMLIGLEQTLREGEMIEMTMTLDNGASQLIKMPVKDVMNETVK